MSESVQGGEGLPEYATASGTELILIRHGETAWNRERRIQGHTDIGLSELGRFQAGRLAARMAGEALDALYSSDLSRSVDTAAPVAEGLRLPVTTTPLLREVGFGAWEGLTISEVEARWPDEYAAWRHDSVRCCPPEGELIEALQQRSLAAVAEILTTHPGERVALFGHGGSVKAILCGLMDFPLGIWRRLRVDNTSVTRLHFGPLGPTLTLYNDTSHLR
jgi:2,3-bisphosphoglycerate-dependent phosphoglycerate mutase